MSEHFFIVGAQRSATTYLYHLLNEHPEIAMASPLTPEPKFFLIDALFERGLEYYLSYFYGADEDAHLWGEKSTSYIESEQAAERIAHSFPDAKILFLLREPIERAISNYWFSVKNGLETLPMQEAFLREEERRHLYNHTRLSASPYAYLKRGRYIDYVTMYERLFPLANIKIVLKEELVGSADCLRTLYEFLNTDDTDFVPASLHKPFNTAERPVSELSAELSRYLEDYFSEANKRLAAHLGRPLTLWQRGV